MCQVPCGCDMCDAILILRNKITQQSLEPLKNTPCHKLLAVTPAPFATLYFVTDPKCGIILQVLTLYL